MKKLKLILSSVLSAVLAASCMNVSLAESGSVKAVFDAASKQIEVSGSAEANTRVTLKVFSKSDYTSGNVGADNVAYFFHTDSDENGNFIFKFRIDSSRPNGWYVAAANGEGLPNAECEFILIDDNLVRDMLGKLNNASESSMNSLIDDGIFTVFGTDENEVLYYTQLNSEYKRTVILSWLAARPEGGYADKNAANGGFYSACGYADLKLYEPSEENRAEIEERIKKIFEGLRKSLLWEKYEGTKTTNALSAAVKEKTYSDALNILKSADTAGEFADRVTEKMILNSINGATSWMGYKDIIDNSSANNGFSEYIDGINRTELSKNEANALKIAYNSRSAEYTSISDFAADINKAIGQAGSSAPSGGGSSGGSGGSGGGGGSGSSVVAPFNPSGAGTDAPVVTVGGFTDMSGYEWAADAVKELSEKKIINGVGEQKFAPGENVTREQFVKMLALTFNLAIDEGAETAFTDCAPQDWSYPYIAAAHSRGLVQGTGGEFGKISFITRQDAAVMTYRFMGSPSAAENGTEFTDSGDISDYALKAVLSMTAAGVIKGVGDGKFEPKNNMTRAQAAQMLYNVLHAE